jgi:hypothetical protein
MFATKAPVGERDFFLIEIGAGSRPHSGPSHLCLAPGACCASQRQAARKLNVAVDQCFFIRHRSVYAPGNEPRARTNVLPEVVGRKWTSTGPGGLLSQTSTPRLIEQRKSSRASSCRSWVS